MDLIRRWLLKPQKPNLISKFFAEISACMMFHFIGSVSPTPWANGIALMVMVYYTAKISGAHLNPALSLTFTLLGHTNPLEMLVYWIAQVGGCCLGALFIKLLTPYPIINNGCFIANPSLNNALIFGWETFCTFTFILPIFSVVWYTSHKQGYGNTGPLIVGLSLIANALAAGPFTGAAFNPARVLGSHIVFNCEGGTVLYYILGEFLGAAIVPLAIFPFYGINENAWYLDFSKSDSFNNWMLANQSQCNNESPEVQINLNDLINSPKHSMECQTPRTSSRRTAEFRPEIEEAPKNSRLKSCNY